MGFENVRERGLCSHSPTSLAFLNMPKDIWELTGHILEMDRLQSRGKKKMQICLLIFLGQGKHTNDNDNWWEREFEGKEDEDDEVAFNEVKSR